jgi:molybdenum cofactor biosynthesis enzyme MoaA
LNDLERVLPVISRECWAVYLSCGGEPLLHPEFSEAMQLVKKHLRSNDVFLVTNGSQLDHKHREAIIDSAITRVQVSIHTLDSRLYSRLYGCPEETLQKVLTNVSQFIKERGSGKYPRLTVTCIAMKSTIDSLADIARWVVTNNIDGMSVQWLIHFDTIGMEDEFISNTTKCSAIFSEIEQILKKAGKHFEWPASFASKKIVNTIKSILHHKNPVEYLYFNILKMIDSFSKHRCHIAGNYFWLKNDGDIEVCHRKALDLDNFFNGDKDAIIKKVRSAKKNIHFNEPPCIGCPYLKN